MVGSCITVLTFIHYETYEHEVVHIVLVGIVPLVQEVDIRWQPKFLLTHAQFKEVALG